MKPHEPELGIQFAPSIADGSNPWSKAYIGLAVVSLARFGEVIDPSLSIRNYLPEPFDLPDHVGNIAGMGFVVLPFLHGWQKGSNEQATTRPAFERERRTTALLVGGLTVAANVFGELVGYGPASTPDAVDFAYGLMGGYILHRAIRPTFVSEGTLRDGKEAVDQLERVAGDDELPVRHIAMRDRCNNFLEKIDTLRQSLREKQQQKKGPKPTRTHTSTGSKKSPHRGRYTPPKNKR